MSKASEARLKSTALVLQHHWRLRQLVQDLPLEQLALDVAGRLQAVRRGGVPVGRWPPYLLLDLLELCAGYGRVVGQRPISEHEIQAVLGVMRGFTDPLDMHLLGKTDTFSLFWMRLWRQQLVLQFSMHRVVIARLIRLFWHNHQLSKTNSAILSRFGFSLEDWITACLVTWAQTNAKANPSFLAATPAVIPSSLIAPEALEKAWHELSHTPLSLRQHFMDTHPAGKPLEWSSARSAFVDRPMLKFLKGWIVPLPDLVIRAALYRGYEIAAVASEKTLAEELGRSLERYVGDAMSRVPGVRRTVGPAELRDAQRGREVCDYAFEFDRAVYLVECKAIQPRVRHFTVEAWTQAPAVFELAKAFSQLQETATGMREGRVRSLGIVTKPIYSLVVTFGEFPGANMPDFREHFVQPNMSPGIEERPGWPSPLAWYPQVFDLDAFESLTAWIAQNKSDPSELFEHKRSTPEGVTGEWDHYLRKLTGGRPDPMKDYWNAPFNKLWEQRFAPVLGVVE